MNKIITNYIKFVSIVDAVISLGALFFATIVLREPISFSNVAIVIFSLVYALLVWITGKRIGSNTLGKVIEPEKTVIVLLIVSTLMFILQNVCTILFVCNFYKSNSIIVPCLFPMIVFQLVDGIERHIKSRT